MIKIICSACQKPLSLDESKLPMKEVSFPCPVCKAKLVVDRRTLSEEGTAVPSLPSAEPEMHDDDHDVGAKALIVGQDHPALRQAVKLIGFLPKYFPTADQAREYYMQETPSVVLLSPQQITPPPLENMQPIVSLLPSDRRKSFFILVADNLRTLDGNAAFLYGVNLIVAPKDLGQFPQIYRDAFHYHERLYASMTAVTKAMQSH